MLSLFNTTLGRLRAIGFLEGASFLVLLGIAMPLKYAAGHPEAVRVVGMAHGILFLAYGLTVLQAAVKYRWPWRWVAGFLLAALLPFGPFVADARLQRHMQAGTEPARSGDPT